MYSEFHITSPTLPAYSPTLMIISNCRPNSGWGTYTENLTNAVKNKAETVFLFGSSNLGCSGQNIYALDPSRASEAVARAFPQLFFRNLIKQIRGRRKEGLVLHYSYNLLPYIGHTHDDIVTIHDMLFLGRYSRDGFIKSEYSRRLLSKYMSFRNIITVSEYTKNGLQALGCETDIEVIHPPYPGYFNRVNDRLLARKSLGLPLDKILILSPSNNKPWKNLANVSKAMKELGEEYLLVRIGDDIGTGISFSNVDPGMLNMIYNSCDLLLFPSLEEGFGFPVVEAMKVGIPAVVSDIEIFHEVGGNAVCYVDPNNVASIVDGVKNALDQKEQFSKLGMERSKEFSQDIFEKKLYSYYRKVISNF